jgi:type I restriction enzyme M protein
MLDQQTKKRIDDCRDILVGKITDPKSQVEQITIALIYKFMDDMDTEAVEMGGIPTYFVGEYERYSWKNIFSPRIGGDEMLSLYGEGMVKMNQNPNLPQLFRDIFKNAYLPYRDPETLKLFLKTINEFKYDHSERLGDAFEYLLSVLGSQGDAGQFRTPRHIIDFIVKIINPKKNETILDPSAGTSGFLISSYKHILQNNTKKLSGDMMTPDERKKLMSNVSGYDISPDMVRLSLVNLFLHGFSNPKVYEYDTLTSEDRWNEYFDVVLANPPFMSPKGGIRPHKRFGIQSNRAEVLFVDYIMEHLTPKGRAGIVVPEGIIFQSGTAYKSLRKTLVEKYLVGVISLPSGVFQPYSGVKTSILILDKELSQKTDRIFFGKVENDGFDLGAQRREIDKNDLPIITNDVTKYLEGLSNGKKVESEKLTYVPKEQILGSGDIGLSYDKYSVKEVRNSSFPIVSIGDVCEMINGYAFKSDDLKNEEGTGLIPVIKIGNLTRDGKIDTEGIQYHSYNDSLKKYLLESGDILVAMTGATTGKVSIIEKGGFLLNQRVGSIRIKNEEVLLNNYLKQLLFSNHFYQYCQLNAGGGAQGNISPSQILDYEIPLPPIEVQQVIVRELEQYQKIIDGARQVVENYKPVIDIDLSWDEHNLSSIVFFQEGPGILEKDFKTSGVPLIRLGGLGKKYATLNKCNYVSEELANTKWNHFKLIKGDIVVSTSASFGRPSLVDEITEGSIFYTGIIRFRSNSPLLDSRYLELYLGSSEFLSQAESMATGSSIKHFGPKHLKQMLIQLPPIEIQQSIVERIEGERKIIEGNKKLIEIYTQKIQDRINKIWGE